MSRRVVLLVNPTAGAGRGRSLVGPVAERIAALGFAPDLVLGASAQDARALLAECSHEQPAAVVAVGGDGLVSMAVQQLANTPVPLAIVPAGTGNDVARALGLRAASPLAALDHLAGSRLRSIDLAQAGDRWVAGVLGAGFDSQVNERANRMSWPRGRSRYNLAMVAELRSFRPVPMRLELDGEVLEVDAMLAAVGNAPSYGGGMKICPDARLDDGLLDVTVVTSVSKAEFVRVFPSVYRGTHVSHPAVVTRRASKVRLDAASQVAYGDGERVGPLPLEVTARPAALVVCAPARGTADP